MALEAFAEHTEPPRRHRLTVVPVVTVRLAHRIDAHESQFAERGIRTDIFREIAQLTGRFVGVSYAEGLEINRMRIT